MLQILVCSQKKCFLVSWQAMDTLLLSLLEYQQNGIFLKCEWTKEVIILRGKIRTKQRMLQHFEVQLARRCVWCGWQYVGWNYHATVQHPSSPFLGIPLDWLVSTSPRASLCNRHCWLLYPSVNSVPGLVLLSHINVSASFFLLVAAYWISFDW